MRPCWTVFQILLMSAVICISNILHGNKILSNILKTTNIKKFIKTNLKTTCKVVLGTYNLVAQTRPVCLLRAVEF